MSFKAKPTTKGRNETRKSVSKEIVQYQNCIWNSKGKGNENCNFKYSSWQISSICTHNTDLSCTISILLLAPSSFTSIVSIFFFCLFILSLAVYSCILARRHYRFHVTYLFHRDVCAIYSQECMYVCVCDSFNSLFKTVQRRFRIAASTKNR